MSSTRADRVAQARHLQNQRLSVGEIAAAMGVSKSTIYAYFADPTGEQRLERRRRYAGTCEECGRPTDGSGGPGKAAKRCAECRKWTREKIVEAMKLWAAEHGRPPRQDDWIPAPADRRYPSGHGAARKHGWNEMLLEAGLPLACDRRPETQEWIENAARAGVPTADIAAALGTTPDNVRNRLRYRGLSIKKLREESR
jgi:DNA-directed RNA polymerase specialized sigma24 family protein